MEGELVCFFVHNPTFKLNDKCAGANGTTPADGGCACSAPTSGGMPTMMSYITDIDDDSAEWSSPQMITVLGNDVDSNMSPYIFPNGTVIMLGRGPDENRTTGVKNHNIFLYRAPSWNSTYTWVPSDGVEGAINVGAGNAGPPTEDPHLYRGRRGFHVIFHSHPDLTHAWSEDGISWNWDKATMGPPNHMNSTGGDNERPRVVVDENGDVEWLFVGQLCGPLDAARTAAFKAL
jgi:hypothetical protein